MRRWSRWAATAVGAAGAGAGLAVARHRRRAAPVDAAPMARPAPVAPPPSPEPAASMAEDPQAALDEARQRLRDRADELRRSIEASGDPAGEA